MSTATERKLERIGISGIVQGVGFRPFVYNLAHSHRLAGFVVNNSGGVAIEASGAGEDIDAFVDSIRSTHPPLSRIHQISRAVLGEEFFSGEHDRFEIRTSEIEGKPNPFIAPDVSICDDCLSELFDQRDRRYLYPFLNCTNCGPRYSIIQNLPYDRPFTTMSGFEMCDGCLSEYESPDNRRFHAQPNACTECGPQLSLHDSDGNELVGDPIQRTIELLRSGGIVAIKGLGGFHLAVDATSEAAVTRLRKRKGRDEKPFALMVPDLDAAASHAELSRIDSETIAGGARPILLAKRIQNSLVSRLVADSVAPDSNYLGLMLPYTPLHYLLFYYPEAGGDFRSARATFSSLVMTSGNFAGQPICKDNGEALEKLSSIADAFLLHNRDIHTRCDDSVVYRLEDKQLIARRSRGFAPTPLTLNRTSADDTILAFGGELKSTICVVDGNHAVLSQHIGDVEDGSTMESYRETIRHLSQVFELTPNLYAYDLHPEYLSSKYCHTLLDSDDHGDVRAIGVQHHHAHVASVMAEHNLKEPVIGFAMDGTGYGLDSNIWGGEVLLCAPDSFKRMAHLKYVPLPGGDKAIAEPWRMAFSYVKQVYGTEWRSLDLNCLRQVAPDKMELLESALDKQINCTQVSSLGRLFDSVASLLDIGHFAAYEGQAAIQLEKYASLGAGTNSLPYAITTEKTDFNENKSWSVGREEPSVLDALSIGEESYLLDYTDTIRAVIDMASRKKETSMVSAAFHDTVVESFLEVAIRLRDKTDVNTVALSGGCWQNRILCERFTRGLTNIGFRVFTNELVPSNDGGLSLGQAFVAANSGQKS